jgi:hypothetical protein
MWQRFWAHGFVQCPFATNNAHELNFAAEETAMTAKTVMRTEMGSQQLEKKKPKRNVTNCSLPRMQNDEPVIAFP